MECNEIRALLSLYIDEMLENDQMKDVETHLSDCAVCREEYESIYEIHSLLGQLEEVPLPDSFDLRLKKALQEEKVQMIGPAKAKNKSNVRRRFRAIVSLAAVFAVGIMTFALYHDVLGDFNSRFNGSDQTGSVSDKSISDSKISGPGNSEDALKDDDIYGAMDTDSGSKPKALVHEEVSADSTQEIADTGEMDNNEDLMSNQASILNADKNCENVPNYSADAAGGGAPNYSADENGGSDLNYNADTADGSDLNNSTDTVGDSDSDYSIAESEKTEADFPDEETLKSSKAALPQKEACSRSLTSSGVERNTAAVHFYNGLIEKKLEAFDYQVLETNYAQTGQWNFRILIFRDKDGNTYNEEILAIGKDGEIELVCSNELMGL